jgi:hypothetical protein
LPLCLDNQGRPSPPGVVTTRLRFFKSNPRQKSRFLGHNNILHIEQQPLSLVLGMLETD